MYRSDALVFERKWAQAAAASIGWNKIFKPGYSTPGRLVPLSFGKDEVLVFFHDTGGCLFWVFFVLNRHFALISIQTDKCYLSILYFFDHLSFMGCFQKT